MFSWFHSDVLICLCDTRTQRAKLTSKRLALTSDIVENIHSVKAYGWEEVMETIINNMRK